MRYIISENRLNDLIMNYLDQMDWWEWDIGDGEFNLHDQKNESSKILFRIRFSGKITLNEVEVIFVSEKLAQQLSSLFSIPIHDTIPIIREWFNKSYGKSVDIERVYWMDED